MGPNNDNSKVTTPADLGSRVRARRRDIGLTQTELALAAGVSITFVTQLERGKPTAQIGKVFELLAALGLELEMKQR